MNAKLTLLILCGLLTLCKKAMCSSSAGSGWKTSRFQTPLISSIHEDIMEIMECNANVSTCRGPFRSLCGSQGGICNCDKVCVVYNDCCEDFTDLCGATYMEGLEQYGRLMGRSIACHKNSRSKFVADCPDLNPSLHRDACLEGASRLRLDRRPVTDSRTRISFLNAQCALCNGAAEKDLVPWKSTIFISKDKQPNFGSLEVSDLQSTIQKALDSGEEGARDDVEWEWLPQLASYKRDCIPGVIDRCPNEEHPQTALCSNSTSYVIGVDTKMMVFQNRHCLLCHGQTNCSLPIIFDLESRFNGLSVLMDFQQARPSEVSLISSGLGIYWQRLTCKLSNSQLEKCEVQECDPSLDLVNGSCMRKTQLVCLTLNMTVFQTLEQPQQSVNQSRVLNELIQVVNVTFTDPALKNDSGMSADSNFTIIQAPWMASGEAFAPPVAHSRDEETEGPWAPILALVQQAALASFPASLLINSTVTFYPEQPHSALLALNLSSRILEASPYLTPTLSSLQLPLITHLQSLGFLGNVTLCLSANPNKPMSYPCESFLLVEVPEKPAGAFGEETSPNPGRQRMTLPLAQSGAWLFSGSGLGLVLTVVLAVGSSSFI